jgi:hypothetical protein
MVFLPLACIAGYCLWLTRRFRWPPASTPLFSLCTILLVLYVAALAGFLRPVTYVVLAGGLLLLLSSLLKHWRASLATLAVPGLAIWLVGGALLWPRLSTAAYGSWDEFSHWGRVSKEIYLRGGLIPVSSDIAYKDYPQGAALLHFFVASATGYSEAKTYYAHDLLLLAAVVSLLQYLEWRRWGAIIVGLSFSYWAIFTLGLGLTSLYVDHVLGALAGGAIGQYWISRDRDDRGVLRVAPVVACLPLIKEIGLALAGIVVGVVTLDRVFVVAFGQKKTSLPTIRPASLAPVIVLAALPVLIHLSWQSRLHAAGIGASFSFRASAPQIVRGLLTPSGDEQRERIVANFGRVLREGQPFGASPGGSVIAWLLPASLRHGNFLARGWRFSVVTAVLVLLLIGLVNSLGEPTAWERWRSVLLVGCLALGSAAYFATLLAAYAYAFGAYDGVALTSWSRYTATYLLAWVIVCISTLVAGLRRRRYGRRVALSLCWALATIMPLTSPGPSLRFLRRPARGLSEGRTALQQRLLPLVRFSPQDATVYHIWQNTNGMLHRISTYELTPRHSNHWCWTIGKPYSRGDVWTCPMSLPELGAKLFEYDYVFIGHADEAFWQRYGALFDGRHRVDGSIWQVDHLDSGIRLRPWPRGNPARVGRKANQRRGTR